MTAVIQGTDITDSSLTVVRFAVARQQSCSGHPSGRLLSVAQLRLRLSVCLSVHTDVQTNMLNENGDCNSVPTPSPCVSEGALPPLLNHLFLSLCLHSPGCQTVLQCTVTVLQCTVTVPQCTVTVL
jgi:hypothetical protein